MTDPMDRIGSHERPDQVIFTNPGEPTPPLMVMSVMADLSGPTKCPRA